MNSRLALTRVSIPVVALLTCLAAPAPAAQAASAPISRAATVSRAADWSDWIYLQSVYQTRADAVASLAGHRAWVRSAWGDDVQLQIVDWIVNIGGMWVLRFRVQYSYWFNPR